MTLPFEDRLQIRMPPSKQVYRGLDRVAHDVVGAWSARRGVGTNLLDRGQKIIDTSLTFQNWENDKLYQELAQRRTAYRLTKKSSPEVVDALLGVICEYAGRALGTRPYPVQAMGALIIQSGALAEMATGEGKSLTAGISAVLLAASSKPVHVLSVNDYLAQRDSEEMRPLLEACGVRLGCITGDTPQENRAAIYKNDVVYATGKELLGDYLRDRLKVGRHDSDLSRSVHHVLFGVEANKSNLTMRGIHSVIVDEVDSVLIDEAVTPLILSMERQNLSLQDATQAAVTLTLQFKKDQDYRVDLRHREIIWKKKGEKRLAAVASQLPAMWRGMDRRRELITLMLCAKELYLRGEHYIVHEEKIVLLDTMTGRLMPNCNLGIGLQQAVEAKENLEVRPPTETIARFSYQKFFRLFPHLAGMSGTVQDASTEFWRNYHLPIVTVPTHRPAQRTVNRLVFHKAEQKKIQAAIDKAIVAHKTGQPVLIGTRTLNLSETISNAFSEVGINNKVLNAEQHAMEAAIISEAGQIGSVTIATNMAGRGTDIKLGYGVRELGGLLVISLEPQDSARVDRQLFGRCGRQGDPGLVSVFACLEDALFLKFMPSYQRRFMRFTPRLIDSFFAHKLIRSLQRKAEKHAANQRLNVLRSDDWFENYLSFPGANRQSMASPKKDLTP